MLFGGETAMINTTLKRARDILSHVLYRWTLIHDAAIDSGAQTNANQCKQTQGEKHCFRNGNVLPKDADFNLNYSLGTEHPPKLCGNDYPDSSSHLTNRLIDLNQKSLK